MTLAVLRFLPPLLALVIATGTAVRAQIGGAAWPMHVIDCDGRGSDGTKLADINGDGWPDVTTAWEEDGSTRIYLNPGSSAATGPWPKAIVGRTPSAEDALFVDLDGDGRCDVVSAAEGKTRRIFVHWAPSDRERLLDASAWRQDVIPATDGVTAWMFAQAMDLDGRHGVDLIIGGKAVVQPTAPDNSHRSLLGWLEAPPNAREVSRWVLHPLTEAGWIMTIALEDMDADGDKDILYSDRYGRSRGVYWLENPGTAATAAGTAWKKHAVGGQEADQIMFVALGDVDGDRRADVVAGLKTGVRGDAGERPDLHSRIVIFRRLDASGDHWQPHTLRVPPEAGNIKGLAVGDIDQDGKADLVASSEGATGDRIGVYWLRQGTEFASPAWQARNISGAPGIKFDLVNLLDLDGDGDLDVLTNEERQDGKGLGVVWYENPAAAPRRVQATGR